MKHFVFWRDSQASDNVSFALAGGLGPTLPFLDSLTLSDTTPPRCFGSNLISPSLKCISAAYFYLPSHIQAASESTAAQLIQHYGSQLTEVTLSHGQLSGLALTNCLESLPRVTSLTLFPTQTDRNWSVARLLHEHRWSSASSTLDVALLCRLIPTTRNPNSTISEPCLCPKLENLTYEIGSENDTLDTWMELIVARRSASRAEQVAYLRKVTLLVPDRFGLDIDETLDWLEDKGMDVEGVQFEIVESSNSDS